MRRLLLGPALLLARGPSLFVQFYISDQIKCKNLAHTVCLPACLAFIIQRARADRTRQVAELYSVGSTRFVHLVMCMCLIVKLISTQMKMGILASEGVDL